MGWYLCDNIFDNGDVFKKQDFDYPFAIDFVAFYWVVDAANKRLDGVYKLGSKTDRIDENNLYGAESYMVCDRLYVSSFCGYSDCVQKVGNEL